MKNSGTHVTWFKNMYTTINTAFYHPNAVGVTRLPLVNCQGVMARGYVNRLGRRTSVRLARGPRFIARRRRTELAGGYLRCGPFVYPAEAQFSAFT